MSKICYIISDLDGTLVDTFEANYQAYKTVFAEHGIDLPRESYRACFGLKLDDMCRKLGLSTNADLLQEIKRKKAACYPDFFAFLKKNEVLVSFLHAFREEGGHLAVASTASRKNILNVLRYLQLTELFDFLIAGEEVSRGKPDPECYLLALKKWGAESRQVLIFEDSAVGIAAAQQAGIPTVRIGSAFYEN